MYKRLILKELEQCLKIFPAVLLTGARQTGKTTLVDELAKSGDYYFVSLDDDIALASAERDPSGWLASLPKPVIIDEVQRALGIFLAMKLDIYKNKAPGRYLLTGSSNPFLSSDLADSLAGRMGVLNLFPLSQGELVGKEETFINKIFAQEFKIGKVPEMPLEILYQKMIRGGFPLVQPLKDPKDVKRWFKSYLKTMLERDVTDISNIEGLQNFPQLLRLLATRSSMVLNIADLSRTLGMVSMTLHRYIDVLVAIFFIHFVPGWFNNLGKRIIKSPKVYICDTGMMAQLIDVDETRLKNDSSLAGHFLETFVFAEILKQKSWLETSYELYHFRDGDYKVDFILEQPNGSIVGIEVKHTRSLNSDDLKGLKHLKKIAKHNFKRGIILHPGTEIQFLDDDLWAVPIQALWM